MAVAVRIIPAPFDGLAFPTNYKYFRQVNYVNFSMIRSDICPLVSCLCVTHHQPDMLQRAIKCFANQTYSNCQMVVIYEEINHSTVEFIENTSLDCRFKLVKVSQSQSKLSLGELRNLSVKHADGEYVCQWDDDDWYDPERLSVQMEALLASRKPACVLSRWIILDKHRHTAYLSNRRLWEGSIMCRRDLMEQNPYAALSKGEDTDIIHNLYRQGQLAIIEDSPEIYVYVYHGSNTWETEHFTEIFNRSTKLSQESCKQILETVRNY